ncbi:MAG: tetracycline resistance MFS efflux pump [Candidatus Melainabacteria bacterium]|nr:MAG: tetracycline resistance MFS efflux pump [Candidatus Melainabacteria bacterium]
MIKDISRTELGQKQMVGEQAKKPGRAPLLLIFFTVFIDLVGFGLIIPVMPTYAQQLKADGLTVGLLIASYSLMQFLLMPFWGRLSDHIGRRPILLISLFTSAVGYLIWGFSNSLVALFASRLIAGAGNANISVAQAYVADVTTPENRAKGMGVIGAAFGLGFVLGPALGGLFLGSNGQVCLGNLLRWDQFNGHVNGLQLVGFLAAFMSVLDLILTYCFLPEPEKRSNAGTERFSLNPSFYTETLKNPLIRTSLIIFFVSTFAFANMEATLVMLTQKQYGLSPHQNSLMFAYIGLLIVFIQGGMIHRLSKKYGEKKLIGIGTLLVACGLILTPLTSDMRVLYLALALLAFGSGINTPSNQSMVSKLAPPDKIGGVLGVGQSLSTLGRILGPAVGGAAYQYLGTFSPYGIGAVAMVVAFLLSLRLPKT